MKFGISLFAILYYSLAGLSQYSGELDSLKTLTKQGHHDTTRADAYIKLSLLLYEQNFDTLLHFNGIAHQIAEENLKKELTSEEKKRFLSLLSESGGNIAFYHQNTGEIEKAIDLYTTSIQIDLQLNNLPAVSVSLNNLGMIFNYQGNIERSLQFFLKSLEIDESLHDYESLGPSYNNVAYIYEHQGDSISALHYYKKSLAAFQLSQDSSGIGYCYVNLGSVYKNTDDSLSFDYFKTALEIAERLQSRAIKAVALLNIGNYFLHRNSPDSALYYLTLANQEYEALNDPEGTAISLVNLGILAYDKGDFSQAKNYGTRALEIAEKIGAVKSIEQASRLLSNAEKSLGNFKESLEYYVTYQNISDSLRNIRTERYAYQQMLNYEYEKQKEIDDLKHAQSISIAKKEKNFQSKMTWLFAISAMFIAGFLIFIFSKLQQTRKQKKIIEEKNNENQLLLSEIHHRVKNNLQVISSLLSLQEKNITDDAAKQAILEGKERVKSMGLIHKMLYQNDSFSGIEMDQYIPKLIEGLSDSFNLSNKKIRIDINADPVKLDVDSAIPIGLIINELVINAFKYGLTEKDPRMVVLLKKEVDGLVLIIEDNGKGKTEAIKKSASFGSKLVKSLVRQINGDLQLTDDGGLQYRILIKDYKLAS